MHGVQNVPLHACDQRNRQGNCAHWEFCSQPANATLVLNPLSNIHIFWIFIPCINRALHEFQQQHNNHPIRTERGLTSMQLFHVPQLCGAILFQDPPSVTFKYGIYEDGLSPQPHGVEAVIVESSQLPLSIEHKLIT